MKTLLNKYGELQLKQSLHMLLFMDDLEEQIISAFEEKPMIWWRYIDNIFFIWEHGEESLEKFLSKLNSIHPTITFAAEYSEKKVIS